MITVNVKLYATIAQRIQGYDPQKGLEVKLPPDATVEDLTRHLNIRPQDTGVVAIAGRVARPEDPLEDGADDIRIFPLAHGG